MTEPLPSDLERLRGLLQSPAAPQAARGTGRAAAVLILLAEGAAGYRTVLVEKRPDLRTHAGQLAAAG